MNDQEAQAPQNIIIRMPNWIGDAVMATPILKDVKNHWPEAKLTVMCIKPVGLLLKNDPHIDEIFTFERPSGWLHREHYRNILLPLKHGHYDLGILLTNSFSSAWWFWAGGVKNRVGYRGHYRRFLLDTSVKHPKNIESQHLVVTYKELLGAVSIPISKTSPALYLIPQELKEARDLLKKYAISEENLIVGINPGAAYGSAKCWLPERFVELTHKLLENPRIRIVYFGDQASAKLVQDICRDMPKSVVSLAGKTSLRELMALISCCDLFLSNDSGPMHIAAALKVPLVALFGSTSDIKTSPYEWGQVIHKHVACSPCYQRACPIDFRCMTEISVDEVLHAILVEIQTH